MADYWEVRRDGMQLCGGSKATFPRAQERKMLRDGGMKIYVEGKFYKESENNGKRHTVRKNPAAHE